MNGIVGVDTHRLLVQTFTDMVEAEAARQLVDTNDYGPIIKRLVPAEFWDDVTKAILEGIVVTPPPPPGPRARIRDAWPADYKTSTGPLWARLRMYLHSELKRDRYSIMALDKASDKVLFSLGMPWESGGKLHKVKGLVIGYVQSGKTANYTALAAKAFDSGYQLVIVLSGIHNALRRQTQVRMNNELGLVQSTAERPTATKFDVGDIPGVWQLTGEALNQDFRAMHLPSGSLQNARHLIVTKKNANVLRDLISWLKKNDGGKPVPTLIIDDEADQATINNRSFLGNSDSDDDDTMPSKINEQIRLLLQSFNNVSYVGYTATPYANVFIPQGIVHDKAGEDLYPEDFIYTLPKPPGYMGPEEFFSVEFSGEESEDAIREPVIQIVPAEEAVSLVHKSKSASGGGVQQSYDEGLPPTLASAIEKFILTSAARRAVEGYAAASTMLIHASHLTREQDLLGEKVSAHFDNLRHGWRYSKNEASVAWAQAWESFKGEMVGPRFKVQFDEIENHLDEILGNYADFPVLVLNNQSPDEIDYETTPHLNAIVIGGNKLSRGLTLEGLTISYFVRQSSAPQADSLTQMGRFFGYRKDLVPVTRLYTTESIKDLFIDVAHMESALRRDLVFFEKSGLTPRQFKTRVLRRSALLPTSAQHMRGVKLTPSYSGDLIQTTSFPPRLDMPNSKLKTNLSKVQWNYEATCKLVQKLESGVADGDFAWNTHGTFWQGVPTQLIEDFLGAYQTVEGATRFATGDILRYISELHSHEKFKDEISSWDVKVVSRTTDTDSGQGTENFGTSRTYQRVIRRIDKGSKNSIKVLVNPLNLKAKSGDELVGLSVSEIDNAVANANSGSSFAEEIRKTRKPQSPLLLIYPIAANPPKSSTDLEPISAKEMDYTLADALGLADPALTVVGLAISFPYSNSDSDEYYSGLTIHQNLLSERVDN